MFKTLLATQWDLLDPAIQQHYGLEDGETIKMVGQLEVKHGRFIKLMMPLIHLTGALVPIEGKNFTVTVENKRVGDTLYWHRQFEKDNKVYQFKSKMQQFDNDIVEFVGLNIGIRLGISVVDSSLVFEDKGYVFKLGSKLIPIPLRLLMGTSFITEFKTPDSPHDFDMDFIVKHPLFGFGFSYSGYFDLIN